MKRIAYSFLLIALISCGATPHVNYHTWVRFQDSTLHDCSLLNIRYEMLIVTPYRAVYYHGDSIYFIPFRKIKRIYQEHEKTELGTYIGGAVGLTAGFLGVYLSHPQHAQFGPALVPLFTLAAGLLIGHNFDKNISVFDVSRSDDIELLKQFALYPEHEPPELQRIK